MKTALLLSGGMDSIAIAYWKRPEVAITINYGQVAAKAEIEAAAAVCDELKIEHYLVSVDCAALGSGDMAGGSVNRHAGHTDWWPYRNQLLLTLAGMRAIDLGVIRLWIGTVAPDSAHRDGTPDFIAAMHRLMALQEGAITVEAPAIKLSTLELIKRSGVPEGILAWAHSCHKANVPCNDCRGCNKYFEVLWAMKNAVD